MTPPRVSVIIVSRDRPEALGLCLLGLSQQFHPEFEIVVVANADSRVALTQWADRIKIIDFDKVNISAARNLGIAAAAGDILAFLDDDAVPLPTWLARLTAPIAQGQSDAAGGYVIGRNGITLQWGARAVFSDARSDPILPEPSSETVIQGLPDRGVKTEGTNMAFRTETLRALGGFDPAFRFYLDETDLNMRLAKIGARTAIVPNALVHHGFAASLWRRQDRAPRSLFDIGASLAAYLRKHAEDGTLDAARIVERIAQRKRLVQHMIAGRLEPRDVGRLLGTFDQGWADGLLRPIGEQVNFGAAPAWRGFVPLAPGPVRRIFGNWRNRRELGRQAQVALAAGERVIVHVLSTTALYHRRKFVAPGYWVQTGGLFGRSLRTDRMLRFWRTEGRSGREWALVAADFQPDLGTGAQ